MNTEAEWPKCFESVPGLKDLSKPTKLRVMLCRFANRSIDW